MTANRLNLDQDEAGYHPDAKVCICGGSGWTPGIPDDEPCPHHAEIDEAD